MMPEGWTLSTMKFDYGARWGVCATHDSDGTRHAVRVPEAKTQQEAVAMAMPALLDWINSVSTS